MGFFKTIGIIVIGGIACFLLGLAVMKSLEAVFHLVSL